MPTTPTASQQTVLTVYQLLTGRAPSNASFTNQTAYADQSGEAAYAAALTLSLRGMTDLQVATTMVRNAGITNAGVVDYVAAVLGSFGSSARGQVVVNLANKLVLLEGDSNFGPQAVQFNLKIAANFLYSSNPSNGPEMIAFPLDPGNPVLTTEQDVLTGVAGNDDFRGLVGGVSGAGQSLTTLNPQDFIDGGAGMDTLKVQLAGSYAGGASIKNIETLAFSAARGAGAVSFDYNAVPGSAEITGVQTIRIDGLAAGQAISVNHVVSEYMTGAGGNLAARLLPRLELTGGANTAQWGMAGVDYRDESVSTGYQFQAVALDSVTDGTLNIGAGIESVLLDGTGTQRSTLVYSANRDDAGAHGAAADIVSAGSLTRVAIGGTAELGKLPGIQAGTGLADRLAGTDGGTNGLSTSFGNATASNLLSVESRVFEVDAGFMRTGGQVNLRFVARTDGVGTDVVFKTRDGGSYVEFALGNVSAQGGAANDTFAFIESAGSAANATFGSGDTLAGGAGADTLQLGVNGIGRFDLAAADFANVSGIETLDLRGAVNTVAMSAAMAGRADTGATLNVRTDRIVQTSMTDAANAPGFSFAEDNAVSVIDLTGLAPGQSMLFLGGSGADRIVLNDATATGALSLDGGANKADAGAAVAGAADYDTLTLLNSGVLSGADLLHIQGFEALLLDRNTAGPATFGIQLTADFVRANTSATDRADTRIDDTVFHIGAAMRNGAAALGTGDAVVLDISNLLDAGRTSLAASLAGRGIDVHVGSAQVRYLVDGAAASAAQVALVTKADAAMAVQSVELVGLDGNVPMLG